MKKVSGKKYYCAWIAPVGDQKTIDQITRRPGTTLPENKVIRGARGPEDQSITRPEDQRTGGPEDQRSDWTTGGPKDQKTRGPEDQRTRGFWERTKGPEDQGTRGPGDQRTRGPKDQTRVYSNSSGNEDSLWPE